jgi:PPK2 family polyphosphate:nucleotide phosphotransferase
MIMAKQPLVPKPHSEVKLKDYDPGYLNGYEKEAAKEERQKLEVRLTDLQERLYAQGTQSLLIVLQAMDAGGKDGTIKRVFSVVNPQGVQVTSFKAPTPQELAHDFLWRVHMNTPAKGYIGIFNRSHYEDVLIVRVEKLVPHDVLEKRYDHINNFERLLADNGTRILKFFLHISKEEQKERFESRLKEPHKRWKFSKGDLAVREKWEQYMDAYEDALQKCNTSYAPWHIVPANHKWYRDLVITRTIVETMDDMKLEFPQPEEGLDDIVIPD